MSAQVVENLRVAQVGNLLVENGLSSVRGVPESLLKTLLIYTEVRHTPLCK